MDVPILLPSRVELQPQLNVLESANQALICIVETPSQVS